MESFAAFGMLGMLLVVMLAIALLLLWICLPFALFGTKPLLRELIQEVRKTNALLQSRTPPPPAR